MIVHVLFKCLTLLVSKSCKSYHCVHVVLVSYMACRMWPGTHTVCVYVRVSMCVFLFCLHYVVCAKVHVHLLHLASHNQILGY